MKELEMKLQMIVLSSHSRRKKRRELHALGYRIAHCRMIESDQFLDAASRVLTHENKKTIDFVFSEISNGVKEYLSDLQSARQILEKVVEKYALAKRS